MDRRVFISGCASSIVLSAGCLRNSSSGSNDLPESNTSTGSSASTGFPTPTTVETVHETITLGDVVERSIPVENEGDERDTVLVTLTAIGPYGRPHLTQSGGHETVTIDPGESVEVTLSWTPDEEVPEGEYDLLVEVWMETNLEDRVTQLDEHIEEGAFTVEKPRGTLLVSTIPSDTSIFIDGELLSEMPAELPVGSYEVTALHGGFGVETFLVTITEGETTRIEIDLTEDE